MELGVGKFKAKIPSWTVPALGYAISVASMIWVLRGVDFAAVLQDFRSLHWGWVTVAVVSDISVYFFQAWRWNLLLQPVVRVSLWRSVQAIYVGLFTNEVLPLRPGEVIRAYLQTHWSRIPFSVSFASVLIERIFDGIWLVALFFLTAHIIRPSRVVMDLGKFVAVVVTVCTLLLALVMFWKHHAHAALPKSAWGSKMRVLIDDLHLMGNSRSFYAALLASLPYLLVQVVPIYALMQAYDLDLTLWPAFVVLLTLRIGTVIPQAPGNVGASQMLMVMALQRFAIDKTTATGLSLMTWGVITLPLLVAGFIALSWTGLNLSEIRLHAHRHASAPAHRKFRL